MLNKRKVNPVRDKSLNGVKIGIVGCGAIGEEAALFIDKELRGKARVFALADQDITQAQRLRRRLTFKPQVLDTDSLIKKVDLVIESASIEGAKTVLTKAFIYKKDVVILSVGALVSYPALLTRAKRAGINIYIPSGAIAGADGLGALSLGEIKRLSLTTTKPPAALADAPYLKNRSSALNKLNKAKAIFKGSVREAIKYFPKNINVSATLLLLTSFKNTQVCIKADPRLKRNVHWIKVEAEEGNLDIRIQNLPSKLNPKTSALTALSVSYLLKKMFSPLKIGS